MTWLLAIGLLAAGMVIGVVGVLVRHVLAGSIGYERHRTGRMSRHDEPYR